MHLLNNKKALVTISEDCLIKIWNLENFKALEQAEPVKVIREHTGPLFSMAGGLNKENEAEQFFFTAGS
jgi:hypothetical protein